MNTEQKYASNRRTIHGLLVQPHKQLGFSFLYLCVGVISIAGLMYYLLFLLESNFAKIVLAYSISSDAAQVMYDGFQVSRICLGVMTLIIIAAALYAGLELSHRVFGPLVPFFRHVRELISGNYKSRVRLRERDEFQDFKDALNELAEALEKKK